MTNRSNQLIGILLAAIMVVSMVALGAVAAVGATGPADAEVNDVAEVLDGQTTVDADSVASESVAPDEVEIGPNVEAADGTIEVYISFVEPDRPDYLTEREEIADFLKANTVDEDSPEVAQLEAAGVDVLNTYWIANLVRAELPADDDTVAAVTQIEGVDMIHEVPEYHLTGAPALDEQVVTPVEPADEEGTWAWEQINVSAAWDQGATGDGINVTVTDTGVDPDHEDIDLHTEDPGDPTYPGGWAEVDDDGSIIYTDAHDSQGHGTATSGLAGAQPPDDDAPIGGNFGVAPDANLKHVKVFDGISPTDTMAGVQYAIDPDGTMQADVVSNSWGAGPNFWDDAWIPVIQNIQDMGIAPVWSSGNDGEGSGQVGSPANIYETEAIGATDENYDVVGFSSGSQETPGNWNDPPEHWPDEWIEPSVVAPGSLVPTSSMGGGYEEASGTSFSAPKMAGVYALMMDHAPGAELEQMEEAVEVTAWKPADWDPSDAMWYNETERGTTDSRYGYGIAHAGHAIEELGPDIPDYQVGDVNEDGEITVVDAVLIQQYLAGMEPEDFNENLADVNRDGEITIVDAVLIQQYLAGLIDGAFADVSDLDAPAEVEPGDELDVSAFVENTGGLGTIQGIDFRLAEDPDDLDENATLATNVADLAPHGADNSTMTSAYSLTVPELPGDEYHHGVFSNQDNATDTITILNDFFAVTDLEAPDDVVRGDEIQVNATIENTGNQEATQDVHWLLEGETLLTEEDVNLEAGEETTLTFEPTVDVDAGEYEHGVATEDDEATANITVRESDFQITDIDGPSELLQDETFTLDATIENVGDAADEQLIEYMLGLQEVDVAVIGNNPDDLSAEDPEELPEGIEANLDDATEPTQDEQGIAWLQSMLQDHLDENIYTIDQVTVSDLEANATIVEDYDVHVVNDFGDDADIFGNYLPPDLHLEDEWKDLLTEEQGALYLDSGDIEEGNAVQAWSLDNTAIGGGYLDPDGPYYPPNPDTTEATDWATLDDFVLEVQEDHEIFTGLATEGEEFAVSEDDWSLWYTDSSFEGTTLAEGGQDGDSERNPTVGITERDGPTEIAYTVGGTNPSFDEPDQFTDDGEQFVANIVEYLGIGTVTGDDTQALDTDLQSLDLEPLGEDSQLLQLDPDESDTVTFEATVPSDFQPGPSGHTVETEDDLETAPVTIIAPEEVQITGLDAPAEAQQYEEITVEAHLEHVGTETTTQDVNFTFAGEVMLTEEVTMDPGDTETVTFEPQIPQDLAPGEYEHGVTVDWDEAFATIDITEADEAFMEVHSFDGPLTAEQGETITVSATIENTGELPGSYVAEYVFDGEVVNSTADNGDDGSPDDVSVGIVDMEDTQDWLDHYEDALDDRLDSDVYSYEQITSDLDDAMDDHDVYLVHKVAWEGGIGEPDDFSDLNTILDNLDDDQGVVFLDTWGSTTDEAADTIEGLSESDRNDPETFADSLSGDDETHIHIDEDHAIFDGVGSAGDTVQIKSTDNRAWFDTYSGDTLAEISDGSLDVDGQSVGVDDDNNEVLLAGFGLGSTFSDTIEDREDAADDVIANAVEYVVTEDDEGDTLEPGESETVEFEYTVPNDQQPGDTDHSIQTDDDSDGDIVQVVRTDSDIEVTGHNIVTEDHYVNDTLTTKATVVNNGDDTGEKNINLFFGEEQVDTTTVELEPDEVETIELSAVFPAAGDYVVSVNGVEPTQVTVGETGSLEGTVTASGDTFEPEQTPGAGEAIEDATVTVFPHDEDREGEGVEIATTDADGEYFVLDVPVGDHGIEFDADDFATYAGTVSIANNETTTMDAELDYGEPGSISGEISLDVVDPDEDVTVTVEVDETGDYTEVTIEGADNSTEYLIEDVDVNVDDGYTVTASAENYEDDEAEGVHVDVGEETEDVDFELDRELGDVTGTVIASGETDVDQTPGTGEGIADATVYVFPFDTDGDTDPLVYDEITDEDGEFTIEDLPVGDHGVKVGADDFADSDVLTATVEANAVTDLGDIELDYAEQGAIRGDVHLGAPADEDTQVLIDIEETGDAKFITIEAGNETKDYRIGGVDVNVDDGYTVTATATDTDVSDTVENVMVDVGETTHGVDFTLAAGEVSLDDQAYEDSTDEVIVESATAGVAGDDYHIVIHEDDEGLPVLGATGPISGAQTDVEVPLDDPMDETTDVIAMLHFSDDGEPGDAILDYRTGDTVTYDGTVEIWSAEGAQLSFDDQVLGTDDDGNAVVFVDEIEEANLELQVSDPAEDFVVLYEGDTLTLDSLVDFAPIGAAVDGELLLEADDATPGEHTVEIYADLRSDAGLPDSGEVADIDASENPFIEAGGADEAPSSYLVMLEEGLTVSEELSGAAAVDDLQAQAQAAQQPVVDDLQSMGVDVTSQFWIVNAVTVDADGVSPSQLESIAGVERVAENVEFQLPRPVGDDGGAGAAPAATPDQDDYTYGLEQIDVPNFEDTFGTQGDSLNVSILDNGLDPDHPDLNPIDGGNAIDGEVVGGVDDLVSGDHGDHVSGTAVGTDEPAGDVPRYSVAPGADLLKVDVFAGGASTDDILAAIEWSVDRDAAVASMSLGFTLEEPSLQIAMEEAMQNAHDAGTVVIGSAGNEGAGDVGGPTTSPGSELTGISVGASDIDEDIAAFSSGAELSPRNSIIIDGEYPEYYPRTYVQPDVSAPGVNVLSAGYGDFAEDPPYGVVSGTSMAAPHVAGSVALVQAATDDHLHADTVKNALAETAEKPTTEFGPAGERDIRYGTGIINVTAAAMYAQDTTTVIGEVTDAEDGEPITGAKMTTDTGVLEATDRDHTLDPEDRTGEFEFEVVVDAEDFEVTADEFGYTAETQTIEVGDDNPELANFQLDREVALDLVVDQPIWAEYDDEFTILADVRNLDEYTVELGAADGVTEDDLSVEIAGEPADFGEPVDFADQVSQDGVPVTVTIDGEFDEGDSFELDHTFAGPGDDVEATTGPTQLTEEQAPATFSLSNFEAPHEQPDPEEGIAYAPSVDVTNTGQTPGAAEVSWFAGPLGLAGDDPVVDLEPGETETVALNFGELNFFDLFGAEIQFLHGFDTHPMAEEDRGDATHEVFTIGDGFLGIVDPIAADNPRDAAETSTVFADGEVTIDDQMYNEPTDEVEVTSSDLQPEAEGDYVIVIHEDADGLPVLGHSADLTGAQEDVTVPLDEELEESTDVIAMLHTADGEPFGPPIAQYDAGVSAPITDGATVTVDADPQASEITNEQADPDTIGAEEEDSTITADVVDQFGDGYEGVDVTFTDNGEGELDLVQTTSGPDGEVEAVYTSDEADAGETVTVTIDEDGDEYGLDPVDVEITVEEPPEAFFEVSNLDAPEQADEGETITVNATVENTGDATGTQDILFKLDEAGDFDNPDVEEVAEADLMLDPDQSQEVEIQVDAPQESGDYEHGLFSDNDSQTATLTVGDQQVEGSLSDESTTISPEDVSADQNVNVDFDIESLDETERDIRGFEFNIEYDTDVVEFVDATLEDLDGSLTVNENPDNGDLRMVYIDTEETLTPMTALTIEFEPVGVGDTDLTFLEDFSDIEGPGGEDRNPIWTDGSVEVTEDTTGDSLQRSTLIAR